MFSILEKTIKNGFNKKQFQEFTNEFFNGLDFLKGHNLDVSSQFHSAVNNFFFFAEYQDSKQNYHKIHILGVELSSISKFARASTQQRNLIAKHLKKHQLSGALVAFYVKGYSEWRLSFVEMGLEFDAKGKVIREFTPAKRSSFIIGQDIPSHTPLQQFKPFFEPKIANPTFLDIREAFSVERVTEEFYQEYKKLFDNLCEELDKNRVFQGIKEVKRIDTSNFVKKLLGQIVFLYFIQKKGWLGVPMDKKWKEGDRVFLRHLFEKARAKDENFFNDYLEELFYNTLNNPRREEVDPSYSKYFECKIPFLNGGLFEPMKGYDWKNSDSLLFLNNDLFSNTTNTGILDIFDRYNFTVKEDEPLEKEVAVDPEMLGKVFENLLEENLRKGKGTYYTPREIVHYMCRESLVNYLSSNHSNLSEKTIRTYFQYSDALSKDKTLAELRKIWRGESFTFGQWKELNDLLKNIKVCDPACGSGAFLVGILNEIVKLRMFLQLTPDSELFSKKPGAIKELSGYKLKKETIQNCIYGVDIDPSAVEIAKLRLWLSLVVDYELEEIEPLPNLDYKVMQGNSLLEDLVLGDTTKKDLFEEQSSANEIMKQLNELRKKYFKISDLSEKLKIKKQIQDIEQSLIKECVDKEIKKLDIQRKALRGKYDTFKLRLPKKELEKLGKTFSIEADIMQMWQEFRKSGVKPFFLWHLYFADVFEEKGGFDVVIANPPYIDSEAMVSEQKDLREFVSKTYTMTKGNWDIYIAFFELGFKSLNAGGVLTFITPDKWISKPFGDELRKGTINNIFLIVRAGRKIFESVKVDSIISFFSKKQNQKLKIFDFKNDKFILKREINKELIKIPFALDYLFSNHLEILLKINTIPNKLLDLGNCENACATSDAYKIEPLIKNSQNDFDRKNQLKIINTGTIGKYFSKWGKHEMTYLRHKYLYPIVGKEEFFDLFKNSYAKKSIQPKLIIKGLNLLDACLDLDGNTIPGKSTLIITSKDINKLKILLSIINCKLASFYIKEKSPASSYNLGTSFSKDMINNFPIPKISKTEQKLFIKIVDKILAITKDDDHLQNETKQKKVKEYEQKIDKMVYKLYGLTKEEIKIVESL